jgi:hypothetical protein
MSAWYGGRDETCPLSTVGGTRRVRLVRQGRRRCKGAGHSGGQRVVDLVVTYERAGNELRALLREHRRDRLRRAGLRARRALETAAAWSGGGTAAAAVVVGHARNTNPPPLSPYRSPYCMPVAYGAGPEKQAASCWCSGGRARAGGARRRARRRAGGMRRDGRGGAGPPRGLGGTCVWPSTRRVRSAWRCTSAAASCRRGTCVS